MINSNNKVATNNPKNKYKRNIPLLYLSQIIGRFEVVAAIFVLFLLSNDLSMTEVMLLQTYFTVLIFLLEVPSGVFADLFGLKNSLVLTHLFAAIGFTVYGLGDNLFVFMLGETIIAIAVSLYSGADSAFIYDTLKEINKESEFKKILGNVNAVILLMLGLASIVSGYLAELFGFRPLFFLTSLAYLISTLILLFTKEPKKYDPVYKKNYIKHLKEGITYVKNHNAIKKYILYFAIFSTSTFMLYMITQPFFKENFLSLPLIGFGVSIFFLANAFGYFFSDGISKLLNDDDKILKFVLLACAILFLLTAFSNIVFGMIFIGILMFFSAIKEILVDHKINANVNSSHRATILSIKNMSRSLLYAVFAPIIGLLMDVYTARAALLIIGITLSIHFIYVLILFRKNNKH